MIENVSYIIDKNPVDYLENIVRVKVDRTERSSGNYLKCISSSLWLLRSISDFAMLTAGVSRRLSVRISRFSVYGIPYSVDDGMLDYIKSDGFLRNSLICVNCS